MSPYFIDFLKKYNVIYKDFLHNAITPSRNRDPSILYCPQLSNTARQSAYGILDLILKPKDQFSDFQSFEDSNINAKYKTQVRLLDGSSIEIEHDKFTKSKEICDFIANKIGLVSGFDFRLFIVNQNNDERVINDNEVFYNLINRTNEGEVPQNSSLFNKFKKKIKKAVYYFEKKITPKIHFNFKKHIFLYSKLEGNEIMGDPTRIQLLTNQIFNEIKNCKYNFSFDDFSKMIALRCLYTFGIFSEKDSEIQINQTIDEGK